MKNEPEINHVPLTSPNEQETRIETLQRMFPDLFDGEGHLDEKAFRSLLSQDAPVARERFRLEWSGKTEAKRFAFSPSRATLRYDATQSRGEDGTPSAKDASITDNTSRNLLIEGDNLEVLKLLQKSFFESVKCIYIDPPYNTGSNYIYPNDYSQTTKQYWEETGTKKDGVRLVANPESSGRFHSNWLNMMYPRILAARKLLTGDGVLICAIDENELATLILMLKEVFGEGSYEYFYASVQHNPRGQQGINFSYTNEYMVFVYPAKGKVIADKPLKSHEVDWSQFRNWGGESLRTDAKTCFYPVIVEDGEVVGFGDVCKDDFHPSSQTEWVGKKAFVYPIDNEGVERKWRYSKSSVSEIAHLLRAREAGDGYQIEIGKDFGTYKSMWTDKRYDSNEYGTKMINDLVPEAGFTYPKSLWAVFDAISTAIEHDKEAIVMDFFAGSGTTAHAVFQKNFDDGGNRKFVCVQIPEKIVPTGNKNLRDKMERALKAGYSTIFDITRARIAAAGQGLSKTEDGVAMDVGFRTLRLAPSNFPENTFNPDPSKSEEENLKALEAHLAAAAQKSIFGDDSLDAVVTEIAIKFGFGLFYQTQHLGEEFTRNAVYRIEGNDKGALLCLDEDLHDETIEALKAHGDEQLIVAKVALDTTKKFELHNAFKDNLWVV